MTPCSRLRVGRKNLTIYRPLLGVPGATIHSWMEACGYPWREDASNLSPQHTRNRIRQSLLPRLEEILGRDFRKPILRLSEIFTEEDRFLDTSVEESGICLTGTSLSVKHLLSLPLALRRRAVLAWLRGRGIEESGFQEVEVVLSLLDPSGSPAKVNLPCNRHARRTAGRIFLEASE